MLFKYAATAVLLSAVTNASPFLSNDESLVTRQSAGSYYTITGATGGVYPRLEIRDLEKTGILHRSLCYSS
jgi:tyrosinase